MLPLIKDKRIRALAIAGLTRSPLMPEVPTFSEAAMPGFEIGTWFGVFASAKTPSAIVRRFNGEIIKVLQAPDLKARLYQEGVEPLTTTPEEFDAYLRRELDRWTKMIASAGLKLE